MKLYLSFELQQRGSGVSSSLTKGYSSFKRSTPLLVLLADVELLVPPVEFPSISSGGAVRLVKGQTDRAVS